jgi:hypothetical protein
MYTVPVEKAHRKSSYFKEIMAFKRDFIDAIAPTPTSVKKWQRHMHKPAPKNADPAYMAAALPAHSYRARSAT